VHNNISQADLGHPQRWTVLWIMCLSLVLVVVSVSSLNVAIPAIQRSLEASGSQLQWIVDSYALVFAGLLLPAGALGDRYGRRGALLFGLGVFAAASLGGVFADSPEQLIAWRALMGAGAAFIMPATLSIVATVFPPQERGRAIAIWAGFAGAGGAIGLISSGLLLERFWWGSVLLINVPLIAAMVVAIVAVVPTSRDETESPLDPVGSALSIVGLVALVYAIIEGPEVGWTSGETVGAIALAVAMLGAFVLWELRSPAPMLDPRFFRHREFSLGALTISLAFFGLFGMFFVLTQFFQFVQGHSPLAAGARILPYALVLLIVAPRSAPLADRFGARLVIGGGLTVASAGFAILAFSRPDTPYAVTGLALVIVALGVGLLMPPSTTAIVSSLPPDKAGVGSAVNDLTREVGGLIGIAVVGTLVSVGYRGSLGGATDVLAPGPREAATDSIGALLTVAAALPSDVAGPLIDRAGSAFSDGVRAGMAASAAAMAAAAILVMVLYPRVASTAEPEHEGVEA
jgi:EmrB/QacA subfamily drug resistance transporter